MMEEIQRMVELGLINQSDIERMMKRATVVLMWMRLQKPVLSIALLNTTTW